MEKKNFVLKRFPLLAGRSDAHAPALPLRAPVPLGGNEAAMNLPRSGRHIPIARMLMIFSLLILAINCGIVIYRASASHNAAIEEGKLENERLVQVISDHTELTFLAADLTLRRAVERQYFNTLFGGNLREDMQHNFINWVNETPQISAMLMTDETGQVLAIHRKQGYQTWLEGRETLEHESYFRVQRDASDNDILFAEPQPNWIDHGNFIVMSRRISKLDGSFGGIVLAAISSNYLTDFFDSLDISDGTQMMVLYENKTRLMGGDDALFKRIQPQLEMPKDEEDLTRTIRTFSETGGWGDPVRVISYEYIPNLHLTIVLAMQGDSIFAGWWSDRKNDVVMLAVFMLFVLLLLGFALTMAKQIRRVEKSEQAAVMASQAKSDFLANMSHELRTPLNAIIGFSEMLDSGYFGNLNGKQKERVHDIYLCGNHLLELINDILEFSKGAAGKLELKEDKINLNELIAENVRFFNDRARQRGIGLVENVPHDLPRLLGDARKVKQVLLNLLSNAVKFSHQGGSVEVSARLDNEGRLVMVVSDRGIGMAPEDIPKAMSVFGQVHKEEGYEGTGLGLPLCKVFTELHGGKLKVESLKGVGTKVSVIFPASRVLKLEVVAG